MTVINNQIVTAYQRFSDQSKESAPTFETYCIGREYMALCRADLAVGGNVNNLPENPERETIPRLAKLEIKLNLSSTPFFDQLVAWANEKIHR